MISARLSELSVLVLEVRTVHCCTSTTRELLATISYGTCRTQDEVLNRDTVCYLLTRLYGCKTLINDNYSDSYTNIVINSLRNIQISKMLSGIKKGKRKKRKLEESQSQSTPNHGQSHQEEEEATSRSVLVASEREKQTRSRSSPSRSACADNQNAAEELRRMLSGGGSIKAKAKAKAKAGEACTDTDTGTDTGTDARAISAIDRFEQRRGKLLDAFPNISRQNPDSKIIVMHAGTGKAPIMQKEDFRNGARKGKIKIQPKHRSHHHADHDKSLAALVAEEKQSQQQRGTNSISMDEQFARNVARLGSRYKGSEFQSAAGASAGADEEDMGGDGGMAMAMFASNEDKLTLTHAARYHREKSRQVARLQKEEKITSRCWWWMESSSFQKHRLVSLGDYVSLVFVPRHCALVPSQCYLVPVQHAESFASCEEEVWEEVLRFRTALRNMFAKEGKGVLFCETVLPTQGLWQARMDVIPVPKEVEDDSEMFFKAAMMDQAEEWGTHNKVLSTRGGKGLRHTVPKGFPYFNVEWSGGGFAQIIENDAKSFPKDFGVDTIAGMMELDPLRFNRKSKAADYDRKDILNFLQRWKEFDWTLALDAA